MWHIDKIKNVSRLIAMMGYFSVITYYVSGCAKVKSVAQGLTSANSTFTVASGSGQTLNIGGEASKPLKVTLLGKGAPAAGEKISYELTSGKSVEVLTSSSITDEKGQASIEVRSTTVPGDSVVKASWKEQSVEFTLKVIDPEESSTGDSSNDDLLLLAGGGQSTDPSTSFLQPLRVTALRKGVPIKGEKVIFSQVTGSVAIVLESATAVTNSEGQATTAVAAGSVVGTATVRATWKRKSIDVTLTVARDEHINIVDGNLQAVAPAQSFSSPLKVQLVRSSLPIASGLVTFSNISGAGVTLSSSTATTDASGLAQVNATAGSSSGSTTVRATYNGQYIDFTLSTIAQSSTNIGYVSGNGQSGAPNASAAAPLVVEVRNSTTNALMENVLVRFSVTSNNGKVNTTLTVYDVSTNALGQASAPFKFGTTAGANTVEAKIVGNPTQTYNFSATTTVTSGTTVDLSTSALTSSHAALTANGVSQATVTFTARDLYGNQIPTGSGTVVFTPSAGSMTGSVVNVGNGTWTQNVIAPSAKGSGSFTVTATYNGSALTSSALTVSLLSGTVVPSNSTIATDQASITANGTSTATLTVSLRDANGNIVSSGGETVVFTTSAGTLLGSVIDVGNGTYSQVIRSVTLAQTALITATVGGQAVGAPATASLIFAPGAVSLANSSIQVSPSSILPNATSTTTVTVTLRDANNNVMTSGGSTVVISSTAGTWNSSIVDNNNGTYQRVLKSAASEATATVSATVNGSALTSTAKVYMTNGDGGPSIVTSRIEIVGGVTKIAADGTSTATVRVTLYDRSNVALTSGGSTVTIAATAGTMLGSILDNGNGTYTQIIRAPASSATAIISATVDGQQINANISALFYGSFSTANSTIVAYPSSVVANGVATAMILIQAVDSTGIEIPIGGATGLVISTTAGTLQGSLVDNANGTYTQNILAPASAANATVTVTKSGVAFANSTTITFFTANNRAGLTIDCSNIGTYTGQNLMVDNGTLTMNSFGSAASGADCAASFTFGAIILTNSAIITHSATTATNATTGQEFRLEFTATSISIDATSKIDVSGKGYVHLGTDTGYRVQGNTNTASLPNYGSIFYPNDLGASGLLYNNGNNGGTGGGRLKITISGGGSILNNGSIKADGAVYGSAYGTGGSGGSIQISTGSLTGTGTVTANGGASSSSGGGYSSGPGGRIAIYYTAMSGNFSTPTNIVTNVTSCGGTNPASGYDGHAGTVFIKKATQSNGDLIIYNCNRNTTLNVNRTVINSPANSTPTSLSGTVLSKTGGFGDSFDTTKNPYVGWRINPNIAQNGT
ncbi:MAG: Ig-like domain-containing protein, partial [Proteobacteria bacterium]|nr:Ig-like domain-containing protein [Pseudomonadota bacterium]